MAEEKKKKSKISRRVTTYFFILSFIPMIILAVFSLYQIVNVGNRSINDSTNALDKTAREDTELRVVELANSIANFLRQREDDLKALSLLSKTSPESFIEFSKSHNGIVWKKTSKEDINGTKISIPLYKEVAYIDSTGQEQIKVVDNRLVPTTELKNVSNPKNTTYKSEDYFLRAKELPPGEIYVSHVTGWYVIKDDVLLQEDKIANAIEGEKFYVSFDKEKGTYNISKEPIDKPLDIITCKRFQGIIRFAMPVFTNTGKFNGVVVLALDHTHLMELVEHVVPINETGAVDGLKVCPDPSTGNWAYMVDDEDWIIAHPEDWAIRGLNKKGELMEPATEPEHLKDNFRSRPIKLDKIGDMKEFQGIETISQTLTDTKQGKKGSRTYYWEGHQKLVAYAPIKYYRGDYKEPLGFGWVAIGADLEKFHEPAILTQKSIQKTISLTTIITIVLIAIVTAIVITVSTLLARNITKPIVRLTELADKISMGNLELRIDVKSDDEIGDLAESVSRLAMSLQAAMKRLTKKK